MNLNKPIIPLLMEKMDWPPKGSMGPIFSEYLFIRFFQRGGEETPENDQRYWPIPKFQELLMQLNFFAAPDQTMIKNGSLIFGTLRSFKHPADSILAHSSSVINVRSAFMMWMFHLHVHYIYALIIVTLNANILLA